MKRWLHFLFLLLPASALGYASEPAAVCRVCAGNVPGLRDRQNHIAAGYAYDASGRMTAQWGSLAEANRMQFSSMPRFRGLTGYPARFYDASVQRWGSRDPIGIRGGFNPYQFVLNNPLAYGDPFGREITYFYGQEIASPLHPSGPVPYLTGDTVLENLVAGSYNAIPLLNNAAVSALNAVGEFFQGLEDFAKWLTGELGGGLADQELVGMGVAAGSLLFGGPEAKLGKVPCAAKSGQRLLTAGTDLPNAGGVIRSFVQESDQVYYRVFSGDRTVGSFLTATPPRSSAWAQEALSLPPGNTAQYIQEVLVPAGTRLQRSRALAVPEWGRFRGGAEQFQLLEHIPVQNFGPGRALP